MYHWALYRRLSAGEWLLPDRMPSHHPRAPAKFSPIPEQWFSNVFYSFLFSKNLSFFTFFFFFTKCYWTPVHKLDEYGIVLIESNLGKGIICLGRTKFCPLSYVFQGFSEHTQFENHCCRASRTRADWGRVWYSTTAWGATTGLQESPATMDPASLYPGTRARLLWYTEATVNKSKGKVLVPAMWPLSSHLTFLGLSFSQL